MLTRLREWKLDSLGLHRYGWSGCVPALLGFFLVIAPPARGGGSCTVNEDCDDGVPCTDDFCFGIAPPRFCIHTDNCPNGDLCDGVETCCATPGGCGGEPFGGCLPGTPITCPPGQFCDETLDSCVECDPSTGLGCDDGDVCTDDVCNPNGFCSNTPLLGSTCDDGDACTTNDICVDLPGGSPPVECQGTPIDCDAVAPPCQTGSCNVVTGECQFQNVPDGTPCDDHDLCTAVDRCQGGACIGGPADSAIDLELRPRAVDECTPGSGTYCYQVGDLIRLDLWLVRNGTVPPPASAFCSAAEHPVAGIEVPFSWDPAFLSLADPDVTGVPNPEDPCDDPDPCVLDCGFFDRFNWGSSVFPQDCVGDGINAPCPDQPGDPSFPANDGDAFYLAFQQFQCNNQPASPACISMAGIWGTTFTLRAEAATAGVTAPTEVSIETCIGQTRAIVADAEQTGADVLGALGPPARIVVQCVTAADCPAGFFTCIDGVCGACPPPQAVAEGPRYIGVIPEPGTDPVAIRITGVDPEVSCISGYVQVNGTLGVSSRFLTPAEWTDLVGDPQDDPTDPTVHVRGADLMSGMTYNVQLDCDPTNPGVNLSEPVPVTLWLFGDVDNTGPPVQITDAVRIIDAFRNMFFTIPCVDDSDCQGVGPAFTCNQTLGQCLWVTRENTDIMGGGVCTPERDVTIADVVSSLDGFRQLPDPCAVSCP